MISVPGTEIRFTFFHDRGEEAPKGFAALTTCHVWLSSGSTEPELRSTAACVSTDNFCKETGRKISLSRAIKDLPRDTRRSVWLAYFRRSERSVG